MSLELKILRHLSNNHNGKFIDITFIDDDYDMLNQTLTKLSGNNLLLIDPSKKRDFGLLGISYERKKALRAKINMNGKIYLHQLESKSLVDKNKKRKRSWKFAYLFNF